MAFSTRRDSRQPYQPVDLTNRLVNPTAQTNILSLTVPAGMEFECVAVAVVYSEPYLAITRTIGWRIHVNGAPPPYIRNTTHQWFFVNCGDLNRPYDIPTLIVPANSTVALVISPQVAGFADHVLIEGRLIGSLYAFKGEN